MVEEALRLNVKWSLLELLKAINGDGKTMPNPLFRVLVTLQSDTQGGVAQVRAAAPPARSSTLDFTFTSPQPLALALGLDCIPRAAGAGAEVQRGLAGPRPASSTACAEAASAVSPLAGGILPHAADSGKRGQ